ncbi:hypothetical protein Mapa_005588 [Marchantia paleacea]|nr:hypothetical protein Mapa_005588 [Marchantia paleacea]
MISQKWPSSSPAKRSAHVVDSEQLMRRNAEQFPLRTGCAAQPESPWLLPRYSAQQ